VSGDAARRGGAQSIGLGLGGGVRAGGERRAADRRGRAVLEGVDQLVAEQRIGRVAARHAVGEVDIAPERDRGGAVILGHAISGVDLHAREVGAEPVAELARLGAVERPVGLARGCGGLTVGRDLRLAATRCGERGRPLDQRALAWTCQIPVARC
jgi:hypothetical protein